MPVPPYRDWVSQIGALVSPSPTPSQLDKSTGTPPAVDTASLTVLPLDPKTGSRGTPFTGVPLSHKSDTGRPPVGPASKPPQARQREIATARRRATFRSEPPGPAAERPEAAARDRPAGSGGLPPTRKVERHRRPEGGESWRCCRGGCGGRLRRSAALHLTFVRTTQENRYTAVSGGNTQSGCLV